MPMAEHRRLQSFHIREHGTANPFSIYMKSHDIDPSTSEKNVNDYPVESISERKDRVLMRNILLCFHYFDIQNRGFVNVDEARFMIAEALKRCERLGEFLDQVLRIAADAHGSVITKALFIKRLEDYVKSSSARSDILIWKLCSINNPICQYFRQLKLSHAQSDGDDVPYSVDGETDTDDSWDGFNNAKSLATDVNAEGVESTFNPVIQFAKCDVTAKYVNSLKEEVYSLHHFRCGSNGNTGVNEYIVFNFNKSNEWSKDLRGLMDP
ncbi:hypothetical protein BBOV_I004540 [Babesia bovis T2Bo]|uniref:hypothetical protein n=1 Tax=Babesia bovis T2Bo TaxID=484906 RepID=UPI001C36891D|nr:hypothetical protein BBOV_I004540 [Babesia bovis T2Bo]EDO05535.2 hypothetical protein BBOV_I004540 [Babesia bovis T2Bo]